MKNTYEEAGIEPERASTHSMRKTAATWMYEMTKDIKCVQSFLGHSDSETTEQYIDLAFRVVREGVAKFAERLEGVFDAEGRLTGARSKLPKAAHQGKIGPKIGPYIGTCKAP